MNLSTVKWAQWDQTQSRELLVCSYVCSSHCAQLLHTILHRTDVIIFPLTLQTITTAAMMSIWGKGGPKEEELSCFSENRNWRAMNSLPHRSVGNVSGIWDPTDFSAWPCVICQSHPLLVAEQESLPIDLHNSSNSGDFLDTNFFS